MKNAPVNVLILCTGNSARSILGEALINRMGKGKIVGYSAGSAPAGKVNPLAISLLKEKGFETGGFRSKSWDEFTADQAIEMDFVFTVCDNAAGESCPVWFGTPLQAHWGIADPAAIEGSDEEKAAGFQRAYDLLHQRISRFVKLPLENQNREMLQHQLDKIGEMKR